MQHDSRVYVPREIIFYFSYLDMTLRGNQDMDEFAEGLKNWNDNITIQKGEGGSIFWYIYQNNTI